MQSQQYALVYLECIDRDRNHYKFWRGWVEKKQDGYQLCTNWGRIGTTGQSKNYPDFSGFSGAYNKLQSIVESKLKKGYWEEKDPNPPPAQSPSPPQSNLSGTPQALKLLLNQMRLLLLAKQQECQAFQAMLNDARLLAPDLNWSITSMADIEQLFAQINQLGEQ